MNKLWIARDKDGSLWIYDNNPFLFDNWEWMLDSAGSAIPLCKSSFKEVTFKNSPRQVELKLLEP